MTATKFCGLLLATFFGFTGCSSWSVHGSPGVPEPICVLENPETGERVRFYKEIPFKVPADYDEQKHIADWTAKQNEKGFTKRISPEDDRPQLAELRSRNLAASKKGSKPD